jgi:pimeloyl-ACP methyl ester carboxylesterase
LYFAKHGHEGPEGRVLLVPNGIYLREDFSRLASTRMVVFYDVRNRGRSDAVTGDGIARGVLHDVDDLDAVRRHFGADRVDILAHSYAATTALLYVMKFPAQAHRVVQIGPLPPYAGKQYPADLTCADDTLRDVLSRLGQLEPQRAQMDPVEFCRAFWAILRRLYVVDPANAGRIRWERCDEPNELNAMEYWTRSILPSILRLDLTETQLRQVHHPVLVVHGRKDRSAAYGGGRDWALALGNARLLTIDDASHAPWIEAPDVVFSAIEMFLGGR